MENRRHAAATRQAAFCMVFASTGGSYNGFDWQETIEAPVDEAHAKSLTDGVIAHLDALDAIIAKLSPEWRLGRLARTDLCIMRLALYEMEYCELPPAIAINEAVELAKSYGEDNSPVFINGILSAYNRRAHEDN